MNLYVKPSIEIGVDGLPSKAGGAAAIVGQMLAGGISAVSDKLTEPPASEQSIEEIVMEHSPRKSSMPSEEFLVVHPLRPPKQRAARLSRDARP